MFSQYFLNYNFTSFWTTILKHLYQILHLCEKDFSFFDPSEPTRFKFMENDFVEKYFYFKSNNTISITPKVVAGNFFQMTFFFWIKGEKRKDSINLGKKYFFIKFFLFWVEVPFCLIFFFNFYGPFCLIDVQ